MDIKTNNGMYPTLFDAKAIPRPTATAKIVPVICEKYDKIRISITAINFATSKPKKLT